MLNYISYDDCIAILNDSISSFFKLANGEPMKESRKLIQPDFKDKLDEKIKERNNPTTIENADKNIPVIVDINV